MWGLTLESAFCLQQKAFPSLTERLPYSGPLRSAVSLVTPSLHKHRLGRVPITRNQVASTHATPNAIRKEAIVPSLPSANLS